jgi:cell division protein FtsQ
MSSSESNIRSLERRRKQKKRNRIFVASTLGVIAVFAIYAVYFSSWLTVNKVSVIGNTISSTYEIESALNIPIGTQLARVNSDDVNASLVGISSIDHVEVRRAWPNEIVLAVTERIAIATIQKAGHWEFVDAKGVAYGKTFSQPKELMVFNVYNKAARIEVANVYSQMPGWIKNQVKTIGATSRDNVQVDLGKSRKAIIGDSSRLERKFAVLKVLLTRKARIYDVSAPDVPVTRK